MVTQVEELHIYQDFGPKARYKKDMLKGIIEAIAASEAEVPLKKLHLDEVNLNSVNSELLGRMVTQVEELDIERELLGKKQGRAIFDAIAFGPGKLKRLSITGGYWLDRVRSDKLACAVNRLEGFEAFTNLSRRKIEKILTKAFEGTRLNKLNLSKLEEDSTLISQAREVIPSVNSESESDDEFDSVEQCSYSY